MLPLQLFRLRKKDNQAVAEAASDEASPRVNWREPLAVFLVTLLVLVALTPRIIDYLSPTTGDEPFYLMTAISLIKDGDLNECNNYRQRDEAAIYPAFYTAGGHFNGFPAGWVGWTGSPYPLPPHPAQLVPASRMCPGANQYSAIDPAIPLPADGSHSELYSKHGLGLSLLVLPAFVVDGRVAVVLFLAMLAALLAANVYLLAREATGPREQRLPAVLTWLAFAFTVPQLPYSFLIFPELPAALFILYAFRRIRLWNNNWWQVAAIGFSIAFIPWLHYRFAPVSAALVLYFIYQEITRRTEWRLRNFILVGSQAAISALLLMLFFYIRYGMIFPNPADHAGSNDFDGTLRGAVGLLLDQQWGLLVSAPIFILAFVGLILMTVKRPLRKDLLWLGIILVPYYDVIANYAQWWGEWCPPARYIASVLPLLALPFAISLSRIKSDAYKGIYAVLLFFSYLTMWGFLVQPHWMYNQPDGSSQLYRQGLAPALANLRIHVPASVDIGRIFPSFVRPYYAYAEQGKEMGDAAVAAAWRSSIAPVAFIALVVAASLALYWWQRRHAEETDEGEMEAETASLPGRAAPQLAFAGVETGGLGVASTRVPWVPEETKHIGGGTRHGQQELTELPALSTRARAGNAPTYIGSGKESEVESRKPGLRGRVGRAWLWLQRSRGLWFGLVALVLAAYAQKLTTVDHEIVPSIRWYALAILVMIVGWLGTYKNKSFLMLPVHRQEKGTTLPVRARVPSSEYRVESALLGTHYSVLGTNRRGRKVFFWKRLVSRYPALGGPWPRYLLAFAALGLNLYSAGRIRADYFSVVGGLGWVASLLLLLLAFVGERRKVLRENDYDAHDVEDRAALRIPRWVEIAIVVGIIALAFALRFYRLGDWTTGMHGDEGETGMDAIGILEGDHVSPFMTGWFSHPNFSFWGAALSMQVFGVGLFGLRMMSTIFGTLMLLPFYLLVRLWFGVRTAIIAGVLLAVMDVSIYFSKLGLNNITTPFFLVAGFYFLFRGLHGRRTLDFIWSGYAFMLTMYFYFGGRLTPIMVALVIVYLFVLLPVVRLPGVYKELRKRAPDLGRLRALRQAAVTQARGVWSYTGQLLIFGVACLAFATPWLAYFVDHQAEMNSRTNDKLIFNNPDRMASQHGATHGPLYIGLRVPTSNDIYPALPVVFEKTPISTALPGLCYAGHATLCDDGFWLRAIWGQTTTTLSILTYRADASSFYTFTAEPVAKPIEAMLIILGIAWALWRWRDTRMGVLSIWFWLTVFAGGVLTIDAPYMPRMVGLVPTLAIFAAIPLNKVTAEFVNVIGGLNLARVRRPRLRVGVAQALSGLALLVLLAYLGNQNYSDYFTRYVATWPFPEVTGQAYFVRQMNDKVTSEGRPKPKYYDLGMHMIYWGHGDNRFLNHGTDGIDMINPSNELPVVNNGDRDLVFMVWSLNSHYLPVIKEYYPGGEEGPFVYGSNGIGPNLFIYYRVKKEQIDAQRVSMATYTPASGPAIQREEPGFGTAKAPPDGLSYPVKANWAGGLVSPSFGRYRFSLDSPSAGNLIVDGTNVLTTTGSTKHAEIELLLAKGPHDVQVSGTLADSSSKVSLQWSAGGAAFAAIPREYIWNGPGKRLLGQIRSYAGNLLGDASKEPATLSKVQQARIDGFLGFRHTPDALGGESIQGVWTGTLTAPQTGHYTFDVNSNGDSVVLVDDKVVVNNIKGGADAHSASGQVDLDTGPHRYELRYNHNAGTGYLEAFWTPPGGQHTLIGPSALRTDGGIVPPDQAAEPPPVQLAPAKPPSKLSPDIVIGTGTGLSMPRGVAADKAGNVYVGDRGNHRIVVFAPDGKILRAWGKGPAAGKEQNPQHGEFGDIKDVVVKDDGTVYVLDVPGRVQVFSNTGQFLRAYEQQALGLYGPNGIALGPDGSVYIADTGRSRVLKLPADNSPSKEYTGADGTQQGARKLEQPVDAVVAPGVAGKLYTIDLYDRIVEFSPDGAIIKQWPVQVGRDDGGASKLAISPDGSKIYMSDSDRQRVAVLDLGTGAISYFGEPGGDAGQFRAPSGIAVGPGGRVYVLDRINSNVQVFTLKGNP